jgi:hypothetical protein
MGTALGALQLRIHLKIQADKQKFAIRADLDSTEKLLKGCYNFIRKLYIH